MYQLRDVIASANTAGDLRRCGDCIYSANYNYIKEYDTRTLKSRVLPFELTSNIKQFAISESYLVIVDMRNCIEIFDRRYALLHKVRAYQCDSIELSEDGRFFVYVTGKRVTVMYLTDLRIVYAGDLQFSPRRAVLSPINDYLICFDTENVVVLPVVFCLSEAVKGLREERELEEMFLLNRFTIDSARPIRSVFCVPNGNDFDITRYIERLLAETLEPDAYEKINEHYIEGDFASFDLFVVFHDSEIQKWASGNGGTPSEGCQWHLSQSRPVQQAEVREGADSHEFIAVCVHRSSSSFLIGYSTGDYALFDFDLQLQQSASLSGYPLSSLCLYNNLVAAASRYDRSIRIFNTLSNIICFEDQTAVNLSSIALSPDGRYLACGELNGEILIYDVYKNCLFTKYQAHNGDIRSIQFMKTSKSLVSAGQDAVVAFDLKKEQIFRTFTTPTNAFECLSVDPSGEIIAASDAEFSVNLFDLRSGLVLDQCKYHEGPITKLLFNSNGELFSTSWDKTLRIMDCFAPGKPIETVEETAEITGFELLEEGNIAVFLANGEIDIFCIKTAQEINKINIKEYLKTGAAKRNFLSESATAYAAAGDVVMVGGYSKYLVTFSLSDGRVLKPNEYIEYSINLDFANIDSDDVLEQKEAAKTYSLPEDRELGRLTREIDLRTRKLLDPIVELENRKLEARIVEICLSSDLKRAFVATSFGVLIYSNERQTDKVEIGHTHALAEEALKAGEYAKVCVISSVLGDRKLALEACLAICASGDSNVEIEQIRQVGITPVLEMLTELVLDAYSTELQRLLELSARVLLLLQTNHEDCTPQAIGLFSAVKVKTEDMRNGGVKAIQALQAARKYSRTLSDQEVEQLEAQIVNIKLKRRKEEMARLRAQEEGV